MKKAALFLLAAALIVMVGACQAKRIKKEKAAELIRSSSAFRGPWNPRIVFLEATVRPVPDAKREFLQLEELTVKADGPFGMAGATATAAFTWRWNKGPFAQRPFRSKARFHSPRGEKGWRIYEDSLQRELWEAERGEEE